MEGPEGSPYQVCSMCSLFSATSPSPPPFSGLLAGESGHAGQEPVLLSPIWTIVLTLVATLQGGKFLINLALPTEYPFKPPTVSFGTKIYHPNITNDEKGSMCLGMLRADEWKPSSKIAAVLQFARQLLQEPMPDDAIESRIAEQYKNDRKRYDEIAKDWTRKWAVSK